MNAPNAALQSDQDALLAALSDVLAPLAQLCLAKGVGIQAMDEAVRRAFVAAAEQACRAGQTSPTDRLTSRISTLTGLNRREVTRLRESQAPARGATRSLALDVLTRWATQPDYVNQRGVPIALPRSGAGASFEQLAQSVTKDVHPKSVLAQMQTLGLVVLDEANDTVTLKDAIFVPNADWPQMMGFLGANVGDHLAAAVANALGQPKQFEQALLADELSLESLEKAKGLITQQWRELLTQLGPALQALMDDDHTHGRQQDQQLRIGLYALMKPMNTPSGNQA